MKYSFAQMHPELINEWSKKNDPVTPYDVSYGSDKLFWWIGACGHEWQASLKARHYGAKCPFCGNVRIIVGFNDLATTDPELLNQWDYEKNHDIRPTEVTRLSAKRVWWKCSYGHTWSMKISERTIEDKGCRQCEADYKTSIPRLAVLYYGSMFHLKITVDDNNWIGLPIELIISDIRIAIDTTEKIRNENSNECKWKSYLCRSRGFDYYRIQVRRSDESIQIIQTVRRIFEKSNLFPKTGIEEDEIRIRAAYEHMRSRPGRSES